MLTNITNKKYLMKKVKILLEDFAKERDKDEDAYLRSNLLRYVETLTLVPKSSKKLKVLDVGTGYGHLAFLIKKLFDYHVIAADIRIPEDIKKRLTNKGIEVKDGVEFGTGKNMPFEDNTFDTVMFCEVLEHITDDPRNIFKEIYRILKHNGLVICTTPNICHIYNRILLLFGKNPQLFFWGLKYGEERPRGHFREYSMDELIFLMKNLNFTIKKAKFINSISMFGTVSSSNKLQLLFYPYYLLCMLKPSFRSTIIIAGEK